MLKRVAAVSCLAGAMASSGFATGISENFIGVTTQNWGKGGQGIFNVSGTGAEVIGSVTFDPADFTPTPTAPTGSVYLASFTGGMHSVVMTVNDAGGTSTMDATNAFLLLCSGCISPWSLVVSSDEFSFSLQLNSKTPLTFAPGDSVFDLGSHLDSGAQLSSLVSDASHSLGFEVTGISLTPEPSTLGLLLLCASGFGATQFWRSRSRARSTGN